MKKEIPKDFLDIYKSRVEILRSELRRLNETLTLRLQQLKRTEGTRARVVEARVKKATKLWKKAVKFNFSASKALKKIVDVIGVRIVCNNLSDTKSVIKMIEQESGYIQIKKPVDMVTNPREDGYRGVHLHTIINRFSINDDNKIPCEIQIRTLAQDMWGRLSRDDLYGNNPPEIISVVSKAISKQLSAIDELAQQIRDELNKPAEKAEELKETDTLSPKRLALLFSQKYKDEIWQWSLYDWMSNLEEAEAETIRDVIELLDDINLREELDEISRDIRGYPLDDTEWVVYSAMIAGELDPVIGIESVRIRIEEEWDELAAFALRETLPLTIDDFIKELENVISYRTKDSEDQAENIKSYLSLLGCISEDMYGIKEIDTYCVVEAVTAYYKDDEYEEQLTELIGQFVQTYG